MLNMYSIFDTIHIIVHIHIYWQSEQAFTIWKSSLMAETRGSVRFSITVPAELKDEMDGMKESVNWSGISTDAFHRKLLEIQTTRKVTKMEDVIKRMKAAVELEANQSRAVGKAIGEKWAKEVAMPSQLKRLWCSTAPLNGLIDDYIPDDSSTHEQNIQDVAHDITGDEDMDGWVFWKTILGEDLEQIEDPDFLKGFVVGAVQIWEMVQIHL